MTATTSPVTCSPVPKAWVTLWASKRPLSGSAQLPSSAVSHSWSPIAFVSQTPLIAAAWRVRPFLNHYCAIILTPNSLSLSLLSTLDPNLGRNNQKNAQNTYLRVTLGKRSVLKCFFSIIFHSLGQHSDGLWSCFCWSAFCCALPFWQVTGPAVTRRIWLVSFLVVYVFNSKKKQHSHTQLVCRWQVKSTMPKSCTCCGSWNPSPRLSAPPVPSSTWLSPWSSPFSIEKTSTQTSSKLLVVKK